MISWCITLSDKTIDTLIKDIYEVFDKKPQIAPEVAEAFGVELGKMVIERVSEEHKPRLRLSNLGESCGRKLWYSINTPELAEKLSGPTRIKFLIGDITERVILLLARLAGHSVTDEQKEVSLHGIKGHLDGKIDDHLVDVKSASPYSFRKFEDGLTPEVDSFGYLTQLSGYGSANSDTTGSFLAVDKVLGTLALDTHTFPEVNHEAKVKKAESIIEQNTPPDRGFEDEADGQSGNRKLGVKCSYCDFKSVCWPGLRVFNYSGKPRFLTHVVRLPKVEEK